MFVCGIENCNRQFSRKSHLKQHQNAVHINEATLVEKCFLCGQIFNTNEELQNHHQAAHRPSRKFVVKEKAFGRKFVTYRYNFLPNELSFEGAQRNIKNLVRNQILAEAARRIIVRVSLIFIAEMTMTDHQGEKVVRSSMPFRSPSFFANANYRTNIDTYIRRSFQHQRQSIEHLMRTGSNWQFSRALSFDIEFSSVNPVRGGSGDIFSVNSGNFKSQRNLYNPLNKDKKCFLYCIAYFLLFGTLVKQNLTTIDEHQIKKKVLKFNVKGVKFPAGVQDIKKFCNRNEHLDLSINLLYRSTDDKIYPLEYGIGCGNRKVNLLLVETTKGGHYMLIKNADYFLRRVYNTGTTKKSSYQKAFFCLNCLNSFSREKRRDDHANVCILNRPIRELLPENNIIKFRNFERQHFLDYVAFLDFECILPDARKKCSECKSLKCKCDCSFTDDVNLQLPICYSFLVLGQEDMILHEHTYAGTDAHIHFIRHLLDQEQNWITSLIASKKFMEITPKETQQFINADKCYLCGIEFTDNVVKVRDHSHYTAKYIGAACQQCNLRRRRPTSLKIFVHNCSKYDMHFIIKAMSHFKDEISNISVLPYNGENFRTLRFNSFEFLDSLAFLQASLAQLSSDLRQSNSNYDILKQTYLVKKNEKFDKKRFEMVLEKSFFPYEFCSSLDLMQKTKKLPKRKDFYSTLSEETISREDHTFAKEVWKEFGCKNLVDYTKLYCKIDTVLLAEIFQTFRRKMLAFSGLDPAYYISLPAYGYDSMLKITKSEIELPTDIDIVHFLEMGKRGGVSYVNTRYLSANEFESASIIYCDKNNLYGEAQMQKLPYTGFKWLTKQEMDDFSIDQDLDGDIGYFIECDLHYPKKLHQQHANFPLAPEVLEINFDNLSPYVQNAIQKTEGKSRYKDVKLMSTFHDKIHYVTHAKNLKLYVTLGLEIKKIHRILAFKQTFILAPYIEMTTAARQQATSKFEMDLFKKMVSKTLYQSVDTMLT